ncbi:MAG: hypothetical protein K9M17_05410 [Mariprofundaceae bacterium]|nr:hypothetical protein [Mariprofundaceae bacterium]
MAAVHDGRRHLHGNNGGDDGDTGGVLADCCGADCYHDSGADCRDCLCGYGRATYSGDGAAMAARAVLLRERLQAMVDEMDLVIAGLNSQAQIRMFK